MELTKFHKKSDLQLYDMWRSFKKMRNILADSFGPHESTWISMLDRETMIEELFNRFYLKKFE